MLIDSTLYESMDILERDIPVIFHRDRLTAGNGGFSSHWHDRIELLYFTKGEAVIRCNSEDYDAKSGDLIVINSNELHQGFCVNDCAEYYCIIFDMQLLQSRRTDACEAKYIDPITHNCILFRNKVENDPEIGRYIRRFIAEYDSREIGYEIAVKATIYEMILYLLRHDVKQTLTPVRYDARVKNLKRFNRVLEYIESHYSEEITIDRLSDIAGVSRYYFCRLFKLMTGSTLSEYLNALRLSRAETLLKSGQMNVTEAAIYCGFNNLNYFSRLFRRYRKMPPSSVAKGRAAGTL